MIIRPCLPRALAPAARGAMGALLALAAAACSDLGLGPDEERGEQIIFLSNLAGGMGTNGLPRHDIYRMNTDGSGLKNLTRRPGTYGTPSLSPDGRTLVFDTYPGNDIWVMNVDGSGLARLTNRNGGENEGRNSQPRWSPDGTRIAFISDRGSFLGSSETDAFVMSADGSSPRNLSAQLGDAVSSGVRLVRWSPAGQVVFETTAFLNGNPNHQVYVVNADGTGLRTLFSGGDSHSVAWSPDGSKVAFIRGRDARLHVMNSDGTGVRSLTDGGAWLPGPSASYVTSHDPWSPDGTRIVFQRWAGAAVGGTIHVINADGTGLQQVTGESAVFNGWSPPGDRILFTSAADGSNDVISVHPMGWDRVNLTRALSDVLYDERDALWLPGR